jgi:hypothetical protein
LFDKDFGVGSSMILGSYANNKESQEDDGGDRRVHLAGTKEKQMGL